MDHTSCRVCSLCSLDILHIYMHVCTPLPTGFDRRVWQVEEGWDRFLPSSDETSITYKYVSEDGEENFPGELHVWTILMCMLLLLCLCADVHPCTCHCAHPSPKYKFVCTMHARFPLGPDCSSIPRGKGASEW